MDPEWESRKDYIMERLVYLKFKYTPVLQTLLLETGDKPIVEFTNRDGYWGSGPTHEGANMLGQILVRVRSILKAKRGPELLLPAMNLQLPQ